MREVKVYVNDAQSAPAAGLADQTVDEDTTASYRFKAFTDEEEDKSSRSLAYTASWAEKDSAGNDRVDANGKKIFVSLPTWIVFDGLKRRFTFKPDKSWHAGKHTLRVVGTEKSISGKPNPKSDFAEFVLDVVEVNDAPIAIPLRGCGGRTDGNLRASPCRAVDGRRRGTNRDSGFAGGTSL